MSNGTTKLPIWSTTVTSYRFVFQNLEPLVKTAIVPFCLLLLSVLIVAISAPIAADADNVTGPVLAMFVVGAVFVISLLPVITKWHRLTLRGVGVEPAGVVPEFGRREFRYVFYWIRLTLGLGLLSLPILFGVFPLMTMFGQDASALFIGFILLGIPIWILFSYLFARVALGLPASAIGISTGLRISWRQTAGNGFRILAVTLLVEIPWGVLGGLINKLGELNTDSILLVIVGSLIWFAVTFISVAIFPVCLSFAYLYLVGLPPVGAETPTPAT